MQLANRSNDETKHSGYIHSGTWMKLTVQTPEGEAYCGKKQCLRYCGSTIFFLSSVENYQMYDILVNKIEKNIEIR